MKRSKLFKKSKNGTSFTVEMFSSNIYFIEKYGHIWDKEWYCSFKVKVNIFTL